jgi:hypothetical protein
MLSKELLQVTPSVARVPLRLPISILLTLPDYVTGNVGSPVFNLLAVIGRLLGRAEYFRVAKVMSPRVWAPGWSDAQLKQFATSPFHDRPNFFAQTHVAGLRALDFVDAGPNPRSYDIVQFAGYVAERNKSVTLLLNETPGGHLGPGALRDSLVAARTRLLILHVPQEQFELSNELAKIIVNSQGPAVLTVSGRESGIVDRYLLNLYANVLHNVRIPDLAEPESWMNDLSVTVQDLPTPQTPSRDQIKTRIVYGIGSEHLLRFDSYVIELNDRLNNAQGATAGSISGMSTDGTQQRIYDLAVGLPIRVQESVSKMGLIGWNHESEGVIPASEVAEALDGIEWDLRDIDDTKKRKHRVLNANFKDTIRETMIGQLEALKPDHQYDLLVDVGPPWDKTVSIVTGDIQFHEDVLPQGTDGWRIQVVLVSKDFSPQLSSAFMWIPRSSGRSSPDKNGSPSEPGPVTLSLKTPRLGTDAIDGVTYARGRLCLYYENNLLQSAVVKMGITQDENTPLKDAQSIEIDFALTGSFQDLDTSLGKRSLAPSIETSVSLQSVVLNLTLNDDGSGDHRILVKSRPQVGPAWTFYDPDDARFTLEKARKTLQSLFYLKDDLGNVVTDGDQPVLGLGDRNGKVKKQFLWDLLLLAKTGRELFNRAFTGVKVDRDFVRSEWEASLGQALANGGVIQIARTGPTNYGYPWNLMYEYPLDDQRKKWRFCKIVDEWSDDGVRRTPSGADAPFSMTSCPYKDESFHQRDVLCPYGFWGLKQIIEQPLSALRKINGKLELGETPREVRFGQWLEIAVGVTEDIDLVSCDKHLVNLGQVMPIHFNPSEPANDADKVCSMLKAPVVVYFLCHGEYDGEERKPYLSIGPRDFSAIHRIYPTTIQNWASAKDLDTEFWKKRRPLVFINGCHTVDIIPGEVLNFVTPFADSGASGVIGTEVNVVLPIAVEVAESLLSKVAGKKSLGISMQELRWDLVNKGNLIGLAYTLYCMADLTAVSDQL